MKTVVITGCRGQIASYAIDRFLEEGYNVVGTYRRCSLPDFSNIEHNLNNPNFTLFEADICDATSVSGVLTKFRPDIILNFAAQSHVGSSYNQPIVTQDVNYIGVINQLEAIRLIKPDTIFWQASTSECMGITPSKEQGEETPPCPVSPYAVSKLAAEYIIKAYRHTYNMKCCYSRMFNSESKRRAKAFVTRKITDYIGKTFNIVEKEVINQTEDKRSFISTDQAFKFALSDNLIPKLKLGNIDTFRSWTHCSDTVDGIFKQITNPSAGLVDYVIGREETHSIKEFLSISFGMVGLDWQDFVEIDPQFIRPSDVPYLRPDSSKIHKELGWNPKVSFNDLVKEMVYSSVEEYS